MSSQKVIVIFKKGTSQQEIKEAKDKVTSSGGTITQEYNSPAMLGFAAEVGSGLVDDFSSHPAIDYVEPDQVVSIQ